MSSKSREQYLGSGDISDCGTCSSCPTSIERCFSNMSDWCELQLYRAIAMKRSCIVARGARYPPDSRVETPPRVMRTKTYFLVLLISRTGIYTPYSTERAWPLSQHQMLAADLCWEDNCVCAHKQYLEPRCAPYFPQNSYLRDPPKPASDGSRVTVITGASNR